VVAGCGAGVFVRAGALVRGTLTPDPGTAKTYTGMLTVQVAATTPPAATTSAASMIASSSAVVNATVNPNGTTTTYAFQYGPTTNYGLQSATTAAGNIEWFESDAIRGHIVDGKVDHFQVTTKIGFRLE
jgi:Dodecin